MNWSLVKKDFMLLLKSPLTYIGVLSMVVILYITVQHQRIFRCAHDFHVGFQDLWAVVLAERQRDVVFESVLLRLGDDLRNLLECTEHDHAGCALLAFHRLLFQKSIAEVEVLRDVEREIRVECSFPSFATLAVPIVAIHIPVRPAGVEV